MKEPRSCRVRELVRGRCHAALAGSPVRRVALAAFAALAFAPAPSDLRAQERVDVYRAITADAAIKVWSGGGSVRVEGWDVDSLAVTGAVEEVAGGRFFLRAEGDVAKLGVEGDQAEIRGRLVVRVPATATVWIRTASADVVVRDLTGAVDIHTVSGGVNVQSRPRTLYAESMSGDLELHIKAGIARARSGTGAITFTGTVDDLGLSTVSGAVDVTAPELQRGRFTTVEGGIGFTGGVRSGGALVFETHSGDVSLRLPTELGADFRLSTFRGRIEVGYAATPAPVVGSGRRSVRFEIGDGGAEVAVRSYSGSITVEGQ